MAEILYLKGDRGVLVPMNDEEEAKSNKFKRGAVIRGEFVTYRNGKFHRKFFVLRDFLFDIWVDGLEHNISHRERVARYGHKGQAIRPDKERFRKDLLILAGWYDIVVNWQGEPRYEARSMSFASMDQEEFDRLYSACIDVGLGRILNRPDITAETVREHCERLLDFDR